MWGPIRTITESNQLPSKNCRTWERGLHLLVQYMKLYGDPRNFENRCRAQDRECQLIISLISWKSRWVLFIFVFLTFNIPSQTTTPTYSHSYTACLCLLGIHFTKNWYIYNNENIEFIKMYKIIHSTALWKTVSLEIVFIEFFLLKLKDIRRSTFKKFLGKAL